jgi:hypothetical protein
MTRDTVQRLANEWIDAQKTERAETARLAYRAALAAWSMR